MTLTLRRCLTVPMTLLALGTALPAQGQESGFAVEVGPPADEWSGLRLSVSAFGETVEPAAGYVRGCQGHVVAESGAVQIEVTEAMTLLTLTVADEAITGLVIGTPDGLYRCVLRGADGLVAARLDAAGPGRYRVWLAGPEASRISARLILADRPVPALELLGLDIAALGPPRAGRHVFDPEGPRQVLAASGTLFADSPMAPLSRDWCAGYGNFDAADAVLSVTGALPSLSLFATSDRDLTIAVRGPDGRILCNDDSYGLNPAVTFSPAPEGDYHVFVGAFGQGGTASYQLYASPGAPSWDGRAWEPGGEPRLGHVAFDRDLAGQGQLLGTGAIVADQPMERLPMGQYCPGFTGLDAPDAVLSLAEGEGMISLYARSPVDLVLAVRAPDGQWMCNDDSFGLNPAVSFSPAPAGEYHIHVGAFSQGATGRYNLYAAMGEASWQNSQDPGSAALNPGAEPTVGRIAFGRETRIDPRLIFDIAPSETSAEGLGEGCVGFITPDQPDLVVETGFGLPQLMVYMVSEADGVLVISGPDGSVHCNDDFDGLNPGVMIPNPQPGAWAIFAGTYGGTGGVATLGVTIANPVWLMDREH